MHKLNHLCNKLPGVYHDLHFNFVFKIRNDFIINYFLHSIRMKISTRMWLTTESQSVLLSRSTASLIFFTVWMELSVAITQCLRNLLASRYLWSEWEPIGLWRHHLIVFQSIVTLIFLSKQIFLSHRHLWWRKWLVWTHYLQPVQRNIRKRFASQHSDIFLGILFDPARLE